MKPIRTAFVSVVPSPYQRDLFRALSTRPEVDLHVFYMEDAAPDSPWPEKPLATYETRLPGFWFPLGSARVHVNWRLPSPREFDVIVINTLMSITAQWLMRFRLRSARWAFWGERLGRRGGIHSYLAAPLHCARGIVSIGSVAEQDYRDRFPEPSHFNIPYYCDLTQFMRSPRPNHRNGRVTFLFCGQMIARKGLDVLLDAFARLPENAHLLLVGREAELPNMMKTLPDDAQRRIEYAGFQSPEALPALFSRADVFVLPSRYDGWGVVVNQALGAGLPVLCSEAVGAGNDLVDQGVNGMRFPADNSDVLASCMRRFLKEPALCEEWGQASRQRAAQWQPEVGAARWVAAVQSLAAA